MERQVSGANGNSTLTISEYLYDGDGRRVKKIAGAEITIFVYDAQGKLVAEYANQISATPQVSYLTSDHLGSPRITTNQNGQVISRRDFMPFGEEIARVGYGADDVKQKFTSYLRDKETDLDYANHRTYGSATGRFTSPDPTLLSVNGNNPQTWNRYTYVMNNPLLYTDPLGLWAIKRITHTKKEKNDKGEEIEVFDYYEIIAVKTQDKDDGAKLAEQLGLTGQEAKDFATEIGDGNNIGLSSVSNKNVKETYGNIENIITEDQKKYNETGENIKGNCASVASAMSKLGGKFDKFLDPVKFQKTLSKETTKVDSSALRLNDVAMYTIENKAVHFTSFIFLSDKKEPIVFSKNGDGGPSAVEKASYFEGRKTKNGPDYGKFESWHRKK